MSSVLCYSNTPSTPQAIPTIRRPNASSTLGKEQKTSLAQTNSLAHTAHRKLSQEAARGDLDLRLLVSHANLLDGLTLDFANTEPKQDSVKSAVKAAEEPKRVQWADQNTIVEETVDQVYDEDFEDDPTLARTPLHKPLSLRTKILTRNQKISKSTSKLHTEVPLDAFSKVKKDTLASMSFYQSMFQNPDEAFVMDEGSQELAIADY